MHSSNKALVKLTDVIASEVLPYFNRFHSIPLLALLVRFSHFPHLRNLQVGLDVARIVWTIQCSVLCLWSVVARRCCWWRRWTTTRSTAIIRCCLIASHDVFSPILYRWTPAFVVTCVRGSEHLKRTFCSSLSSPPVPALLIYLLPLIAATLIIDFLTINPAAIGLISVCVRVNSLPVRKSSNMPLRLY